MHTQFSSGSSHQQQSTAWARMLPVVFCTCISMSWDMRIKHTRTYRSSTLREVTLMQLVRHLMQHTDQHTAYTKSPNPGGLTCWHWLQMVLCFREGTSQTDRRPEKWMTANSVPSGLRLMWNTPSWTWPFHEWAQMSVPSTEGKLCKSSLSPFHLHV